MSEYHVVEVIFNDESVLVQSLKEMGYVVEVNKEPVSINGYGGSKIAANAHIVVRKSQFGGYGDVGFEKTAKGFVMHADDYDVGEAHRNRFKLNNLNKKYIENKLKRFVNTTSSCNIFSRTENSGKDQVEIHLRIE